MLGNALHDGNGVVLIKCATPREILITAKEVGLTHPQKWSTDLIYQCLRQRIMDFDLYPGARVTEVRLAEEFGVSRTPIREALQRLSAEGYLTIKPKNGCFIRELHMFELLEYYDVRIGLEVEVVELLGRRVPHRAIMDLASLWDPNVMVLGNVGDESFRNAEETFHLELAGLTGNLTLQKYLTDINDHIRVLRRFGFPDQEAVISTYQEHHEICRAILRNDIADAKCLMRDHIEVSQSKGRKVTLAQLEKLRPDKPSLDRSG